MLGQWKNYDDLEDALTLEELTITYNKILENRSEHMEFSAKLAGAEIKKSGSSGKESSAPKESSLVENLRKANENKLQSQAKSNKPTSFSDGVAYRVI